MKSNYHFKFEDLLVYQKSMDFGEGYPGSDAQFIKHLNHAIFSSNECVSCSTKAKRRAYVNNEQDEENRKLISELTKMMTSLRKKILERKHSTNP